ncbi:Pentapeptide repeats (9 copies) [uncultured archaeon]|nr:Pentapeptide repeats (9 copies) [uncultured archaeon]
MPISRWMMLFAVCLLLCGACTAQPGAAASSSQDSSSSALEAGIVAAKIRSGEQLDYDNITVTGPLDLAGLQAPLRQPVRIINSQFSGPVNFEGVTFGEPLDLRGTAFQENVSFARVKFLGDAKFAGARFLGQADFRDAVFEGLASFTSATFFNDTSFGNVQFDGDAIFLASQFARDVDFNFARFIRLGYFQDVLFENVSFLESQFGGHATFLNARFGGNATFAATGFDSDVVFRSARLLSGSTFGLSSFGGLADFANVEFKKTAFFGGVKFADLAYFVNARFNEDLILEDARLYSMQLDNVTFGEEARINLNGADFTKFVVRWNAIKNRMVYNGAAYLALVKNYKSLEWFEDADDCYYQYRRIGQDMEPWGWAKISDIVSWLSCGYGVRVSYTAFCCLFTILLFGLIFWAGKGMNKFEIEGMELPGNPSLRPSKRVSLTDALYFSIAMFTTSQAPVNTYPVGFYRHLAMMEGILGWFFLGLFVVVLSGVLIR